MASINLLAVFNPSNYWRSGFITLPWQPIYQQFQIPPEELVLSDLRDLSHAPIKAQVDHVDPESLERDTLIFSLSKPIPPGSEDDMFVSGFIKLDRGKPMPQNSGEPFVEVVYGADGRERGVRLSNSRLIVWFNLIPAPEDNERNWFSGSATSIQLDHQEILDPFPAARGEWLGQDPEKRCMQVAALQLPGVSDPKLPYYQVHLYNHSYSLVSQSSGCVRASITIASEPFNYMGADPVTGHNRHLICKLYRVISLYAGADYLIEELFVKGKPKAEEDRIIDSPEVVYLNFGLHYFAHMNMGHTQDIQQVFPVPDWFALGSTEPPYPAYGLTTNLHIESLVHPYEGNPSNFSCQLLPGKFAKCLHLFMRNQPNEFDTRVGHFWYEMIYSPLRAEIYQDTELKYQIQNQVFATV
ncbi:hypothetical protein DSM106972_045890 [Dulcicalothrix desertica PCC 7102]|uniref:Uncharacterized protein n=1 Tax=Dulcicalothrix desertica PCC 7102 TaxID=232991 RepID=A0A433VE31_9CYAN|nr:hypothetical protein [Dulcicalothrix desertica]RUT04361.1 hypothetical protein DSM106972_045890 [Dulcicalothrix desertica PCC 7102]TWH51215.1 hypothetical protein CAL7102_05600 [Dulcicalothrix desertica PCC 7102]